MVGRPANICQQITSPYVIVTKLYTSLRGATNCNLNVVEIKVMRLRRLSVGLAGAMDVAAASKFCQMFSGTISK